MVLWRDEAGSRGLSDGGWCALSRLCLEEGRQGVAELSLEPFS